MVHGQDGGSAVFNYADASGKKQSVDVVDKYYPKKLVQPIAKADAQIDPKLRRAATIAEERAHAHSLSKCWHFVKDALVAAGVVKSRPQTTLAKQAGQELVNSYGFRNFLSRIPTRHLSGLCWSMAPRAQQATLRSALRTASLAIFAQRYHHVDRS